MTQKDLPPTKEGAAREHRQHTKTTFSPTAAESQALTAISLGYRLCPSAIGTKILLITAKFWVHFLKLMSLVNSLCASSRSRMIDPQSWVSSGHPWTIKICGTQKNKAGYPDSNLHSGHNSHPPKQRPGFTSRQQYLWCTNSAESTSASCIADTGLQILKIPLEEKCWRGQHFCPRTS